MRKVPPVAFALALGVAAAGCETTGEAPDDPATGDSTTGEPAPPSNEVPPPPPLG